MFPGKPHGIPPVVGHINGIALGNKPSPQSLGKPPFILNEQDPHHATIPQPTSPHAKAKAKAQTNPTTSTPEPKPKPEPKPDHVSAGSRADRTVGVRGLGPRVIRGEKKRSEFEGDPLNQPGGHWERAATS